jgi:hypothetical protein
MAEKMRYNKIIDLLEHGKQVFSTSTVPNRSLDDLTYIADADYDAVIIEMMTSRSNCAKDNRTFRVRRPIEVVVLNCCVTDTKEVRVVSRISTILAKSASERVKRSIL